MRMVRRYMLRGVIEQNVIYHLMKAANVPGKNQAIAE